MRHVSSKGPYARWLTRAARRTCAFRRSQTSQTRFLPRRRLVSSQRPPRAIETSQTSDIQIMVGVLAQRIDHPPVVSQRHCGAAILA